MKRFKYLKDHSEAAPGDIVLAHYRLDDGTVRIENGIVASNKNNRILWETAGLLHLRGANLPETLHIVRPVERLLDAPYYILRSGVLMDTFDALRGPMWLYVAGCYPDGVTYLGETPALVPVDRVRKIRDRFPANYKAYDVMPVRTPQDIVDHGFAPANVTLSKKLHRAWGPQLQALGTEGAVMNEG